MSQTARIKRQLESVRQVSEGMLQTFQTPEQWTHQVHPSANHALWFVGHMCTADNFFLSVIAPDQAKELEGFNEKFGMGSQPTSDPAEYPPAEEVLEVMRERRQTLLSVLGGLTDEDLAKPTPEGTPDMFPDIGSFFEMATWHEALHAGQVSIARRALGNEPLFGTSPEEAEAH